MFNTVILLAPLLKNVIITVTSSSMNDDHRDKPFSGTKLNINKNSGIEPEIVFYVIDDNDNSK